MPQKSWRSRVTLHVNYPLQRWMAQKIDIIVAIVVFAINIYFRSVQDFTTFIWVIPIFLLVGALIMFTSSDAIVGDYPCVLEWVRIPVQIYTPTVILIPQLIITPKAFSTRRSQWATSGSLSHILWASPGHCSCWRTNRYCIFFSTSPTYVWGDDSIDISWSYSWNYTMLSPRSRFLAFQHLWWLWIPCTRTRRYSIRQR